MQKRVIGYVCRVPALITTNPLFKKTGVLKLNNVYKLQICKLMCYTITGFDVDHNRFTLASSVYSHNTEFSNDYLLGDLSFMIFQHFVVF